MQKHYLLMILLLFGGFTALGQTKVTREEYVIYENVLKEIYKQNRQTYSNECQFVILENTKIASMTALKFDRRYRELVKEFKSKNRKSGQIEKMLPKGKYSETYYLVTQNEIDALFKQGKIEFDKRYEVEKKEQGLLNPGGTVWTPFYQKYPEASGYYVLSRVAFKESYAMVQVERKDIMSGFTLTYILKNEKGRWKNITSDGSVWIA